MAHILKVNEKALACPGVLPLAVPKPRRPGFFSLSVHRPFYLRYPQIGPLPILHHSFHILMASRKRPVLFLPWSSRSLPSRTRFYHRRQSTQSASGNPGNVKLTELLQIMPNYPIFSKCCRFYSGSVNFPLVRNGTAKMSVLVYRIVPIC